MCEQHPSANYHHFPAHRCKYFFKPFSLSVTLYKSYFFLQLFINYHHLNYNVEHFDTCSLIIPIPNEQKVTQVKKNKGRTRKENREGLNTVRAKITATRRNTHTHTLSAILFGSSRSLSIWNPLERRLHPWKAMPVSRSTRLMTNLNGRSSAILADPRVATIVRASAGDTAVIGAPREIY